MAKEMHEFQAETKKLLDLMVHSIYTNHEIFLRELISNASDAIDKVRFEGLTDHNLLADGEDYEIYLLPDAESKTLTISDNGIGMTREEVMENLGTIAKSGTKAFMEKMKEKAGENSEAADGENKEEKTATEKDLIGQFGVGFYSAFIVADKVTVITKKAGTAEATRWESDGLGTFSVEAAEKDTRGTTIILHLSDEFTGKEAEENFSERYKLQDLVKKYSDYVRYPIKMDFEIEETPKDADGKPVEGAEKIKRTEVRTLNSMQPLWTRNKNDITQEEYNDFYKSQFSDWEDPMEIFHVTLEGTTEYTALMYIPAKAPFNLYHTDFEPGLQLFSRHVFIMENCKDLLPDYLRFIKGLVDSPDLSLNISRELLQQSRELKTIGKSLEKTILKTLAKMMKNERERYEKFWAAFGKSLKIGVYDSIFSNPDAQEKLKDLLLFESSKENKLTSLKEYIGRMPESQKEIYYASGKDRALIEKLPQMEQLKSRGLEVFYLTDPVDEFCVDTLREYEGKKFRSISRGELDLGDAEAEEVKKETEDIAKKNDGLMKDIKKALGDKVSDVKVSKRLKTSAVCLVADENGPSISMEKTFAAMDNPMFKAQRILEINPHHALFEKLAQLHAAGAEGEEFKDYCGLLYTQALLIEGILPDDPIGFANKLADLMAK
ncbi:MAG: molecular chaperone HtpG [Selenomonadaceae bacterium]|nr:molecular chaperone HtpG [Selenomonadaceae bacterium]